MPEPLDRLWSRVRRVSRLSVWLALACLGAGCAGAGCQVDITRQFSLDVGNLSRADRIDISYELGWNSQSGKLEAPPVARVTDRQRIAKVAAFIGRYRDGWNLVVSASPAYRFLAFHDGDRLLTQIGVYDSGITHDGNARALSPAEVAELVDLLGVPWPSQKSPQGPPPGGNVR
jgi:hypothetical protein